MAADAPQIATDPADRNAKRGPKPNILAIKSPNKIVNITPLITMITIGQPKSIIISKLTLSPSIAIPKRSNVRDENFIPNPHF